MAWKFMLIFLWHSIPTCIFTRCSWHQGINMQNEIGIYSAYRWVTRKKQQENKAHTCVCERERELIPDTMLCMLKAYATQIFQFQDFSIYSIPTYYNHILPLLLLLLLLHCHYWDHISLRCWYPTSAKSSNTVSRGLGQVGKSVIMFYSEQVVWSKCDNIVWSKSLAMAIRFQIHSQPKVRRKPLLEVLVGMAFSHMILWVLLSCSDNICTQSPVFKSDLHSSQRRQKKSLFTYLTYIQKQPFLYEKRAQY